MTTTHDNLTLVRDSARSLLTRTSNPPAAHHTPHLLKALAPGVAGFVAPPPAAATRKFSVFNPQDDQQAADLVTRFIALATAQPGAAGLQSVMQLANAEAASLGLDLVKHALSVFIVNNPEGRKLPLPRLFEREPELLQRRQIAPSNLALEGALHVAPAAAAAALAPPDETKLAWYREDPFVNEHHEHWHIVYPGRGVNGKLKDRQGELFDYMHQQMLARYNTERVAAGLPLVVPYADYRVAIVPGYDSGLQGYKARPAMTPLRDLPSSPITGLETTRDRVNAAVEAGQLTGTTAGQTLPVTSDLLGATVEASAGSASSAQYGSLHNSGHMFIASTVGVANQDYGVMANTATAVMDPVFFQWHRFIDDVFFAAQQKMAPYNFSDAPKASLRHALLGAAAGPSPDIILCAASQVPGYHDPNPSTVQHWADTTFGGAAWNTDFSGKTATSTDVLTTYLATTSFTISEEPADPPVKITYLDQDEFVYFLRIQNDQPTPQKITARIWLVDTAHAEDRRMWIEMDTFTVALAASAKQVVYRPAKVSSVIKKSHGAGQKPPTLLDTKGGNALHPDSSDYCDCGWPYNLLVPKGTAAGTPFTLMVMLTTDDINMQTATTDCGGVSLCGARTAKFPDSRPMGYPFSRPFAPGTTIAGTINGHNNMASRPLSIHFRGAGP